MNEPNEKCKQCGAKCCKSVIVPFPILTGENRNDLDEWIDARGFSIISEDSNRLFIRIPHRCPQLTDEGLCSIQDKKPKACRDFPPGGVENCGWAEMEEQINKSIPLELDRRWEQKVPIAKNIFKSLKVRGEKISRWRIKKEMDVIVPGEVGSRLGTVETIGRDGIQACDRLHPDRLHRILFKNVRVPKIQREHITVLRKSVDDESSPKRSGRKFFKAFPKRREEKAEQEENKKFSIHFQKSLKEKMARV